MADAEKCVEPSALRRRPSVDMTRPGIYLILWLLAASCSSPGPALETPTGELSGVVLAGPTCPVEQPDVDCPPAPVTGTVELVQNGVVVDSVEIDLTGSYRIHLAPGLYTVRVDTGENVFPSCPTAEIAIEEADKAVHDISCDTGLR